MTNTITGHDKVLKGTIEVLAQHGVVGRSVADVAYIAAMASAIRPEEVLRMPRNIRSDDRGVIAPGGTARSGR